MTAPSGARNHGVDLGSIDPGDIRFALVLPDGWMQLDLDPATRGRSVDRLVKSAIGGGDSMARYRREAALAFRSLVRDAADDGAFFAATLSTHIGGLPLAASVLAFLVPLPLGEDGHPVGVDEVAARLAVSTADEGDLHEPPTLVDLPVGRAARVRARGGVGVAASNGEEPPVDGVRFYVPVPSWDRLFVLAFSTPSLPAADAFADLFDILAQTARWRSAS